MDDEEYSRWLDSDLVYTSPLQVLEAVAGCVAIYLAVVPVGGNWDPYLWPDLFPELVGLAWITWFMALVLPREHKKSKRDYVLAALAATTEWARRITGR